MLLLGFCSQTKIVKFGKKKHFRYGTDEMARKKSISAIDWILLNVQLEIMIRHVTMIKK